MIPAPPLCLILLAAGQSRRMQGRHKMLEDIGGQPMVRRCAQTALDSALGPVFVVTGFNAAAVADALSGVPVTLVHAPDYADGLSASLRAGLRACPSNCRGALILLADMPELRPNDLQRLYAAWQSAQPPAIAVATRGGQRGNPVLWDRTYFDALAAITGDTGGRHVLEQNRDHVIAVDVGSDAIFTDIDTPDDLAAIRARISLDRQGDG